MDYKQKFWQILQIKNSKNLEWKSKNIDYCTKVLQHVLKNKKVYDYLTVAELENNQQGVYLIYALDENKKIKLSYVGESTDIKTRWKKHIYNYKNKIHSSYRLRRLEPNLSNLRFVVLKKTAEQNARLKTETYYIYTFRSRFVNANSKLASKKMRCNFGHGVKRTYLSYQVIDEQFELYIYGRCWNKACKEKFLIDRVSK